jgi:catechol 2,3-dioxygenase-like lactoylglutathione lyase family enzyme
LKSAVRCGVQEEEQSMPLDALFDEYDRGQLSRRDLLSALGVLLGAPTAAVAAEPAVGPVKQLNHVSIFVPDVKKSAEWYQALFGMPVLTPQDPGVNLNAGAGFLGIYPAPNAQKGSINHLCLGIENFDAERVLTTLTDRGVTARIRQRGDTKELYLTDPDGISVQLQDTSYIGGTGPLGNRKP